MFQGFSPEKNAHLKVTFHSRHLNTSLQKTFVNKLRLKYRLYFFKCYRENVTVLLTFGRNTD